jgi:hypothetical protein
MNNLTTSHHGAEDLLALVDETLPPLELVESRHRQLPKPDMEVSFYFDILPSAQPREATDDWSDPRHPTNAPSVLRSSRLLARLPLARKRYRNSQLYKVDQSSGSRARR